MNSNKKKIAYLTNSSVPSMTANSIHVVKMCEVWGIQGHEVELIVPDSERVRSQIEVSVDNVYNYYGVSNVFRLLRVIEREVPGGKYLYAIKIIFYLKKNKFDIIYSRDLLLSSILVFAGLEVVYEAHFTKTQNKIPSKWLYSAIKESPKLRKVISITHSLKKEMLGHGWPAEKIEVVPDAASYPSDYTSKSIISNRFIVGYLGHLYPGKGMEVISGLAPLLPEVEFHIVGGRHVDINLWKKRILSENVIFHGFIPQANISPFLNSFDCCLLPNQKFVKTSGGADMDIGHFTSPLKMFDYLAHGKPIIASNLDVLKEVLTEELALFCNPETITEWKKAIILLKENESLRMKIGRAAKAVFDEKYSWNKRAALVLEKIKK